MNKIKVIQIQKKDKDVFKIINQSSITSNKIKNNNHTNILQSRQNRNTKYQLVQPTNHNINNNYAII